MFSNMSASILANIEYPIKDFDLPFAEYIKQTQDIIKKHRIPTVNEDPNKALDANSPYELYPQTASAIITAGKKHKYGALLIHGLLDSPLSLRDIGTYLQHHGVLSRAILLPGHGTTPKDLTTVSYHTWVEAVRYGVEAMRKECENIYLIGYSTGSTLSIYQNILDDDIHGLVLLSPALKIRAPVPMLKGMELVMKRMNRMNKEWIYIKEEIDYAKYQSIPFNAVFQVDRLTCALRELRKDKPLKAPVLMILSYEDETISSRRAIEYFLHFSNQESKLLLYSAKIRNFKDSRITVRSSVYPALHIENFSHTAIPFSPTNNHYGEQGDFIYASKPGTKYNYGAYHRVAIDSYNLLHGMKVVSRVKRALTYNPDFDFMAKNIADFVVGK